MGHGQCSFSGTKRVRYGKGDTWTQNAFTDGVLCGNSVFGDPLYGTGKECAVWLDLSCGGEWTYCAPEHGNCNFDGTKYVKYGSGNSWTAMEVTSTACSNGVFGDPLYGTGKECHYYQEPTIQFQTASYGVNC